MVNSRARNKTILLDHHLATGTEATYTYTPTTALDMKNIYREIYIIMTAKSTAALGIFLKINAATDYDYTNEEMDVSADAYSLTAAGSSIALIAANLIDGAVSFFSKINIWFNDANDLLQMESSSAASHEGTRHQTGEVQTSATTITSIEILVDTSTWIAGTEITTYGILR